MAEKNDSESTNEKADELSLRRHFSWGDTPSEVLDTLYSTIYTMAEDCQSLSSQDIDDRIEEWDEEEDDRIYDNVYKELFETIFTDSLSESMAELHQFCKQEVPAYAETIRAMFQGTEVFSVILEAFGILNRIDGLLLELDENYWFRSHFRGWTAEQIVESYGEWALKHHDPEKEPDYEILVECYRYTMEIIEKANYEVRLYDLAARLITYNEYFVKANKATYKRQDTIVLSNIRSQSSQKPDDLMNTAKAMKKYCVSRMTLHRYAIEGKIQKYKYREGRTTDNYWSEKELDNMFFEKGK